MDPIIAQHRARQDELVQASQTILARADAEKRDLTEQETGEIAANTAEFDRLEREIRTRESVVAQMERLNASAGRRTSAEEAVETEDEEPVTHPVRAAARQPAPQPDRPRTQVLGSAARHLANHGFRAFGEFVAAVRVGSSRGGNIDPRLQAAAASSFGNESSGADGGFAVPPEYRDRIVQQAFGEDSLFARTDQQIASGNSMVYPSDTTTPWGSAGVRVFWEGEAAAITQSKPNLKPNSVRLHKIAALVPMTDELLEDAPSMGAYVSSKVGEAMDFAVSDAIAWGTGVGMPLGFMNSPALVTVAAESGQAADTIVAPNIHKMWSRMPVRNRQRAVWLVNPDAEPQLNGLTMGGTAQAFPVYLPPGGLSASPYGTLMGRPVIPHQSCKTVGDLGDFVFVDLSAYLTLRKTSGMKAQMSIHLWFDQDLTAFKFTFRVAGQPWLDAPIQPKNGSNTMSPFVGLAAR